MSDLKVYDNCCLNNFFKLLKYCIPNIFFLKAYSITNEIKLLKIKIQIFLFPQ